MRSSSQWHPIAAFLVACVALAYSEQLLANEPAAARPNIVPILRDDLGYVDVGFNAQHFGVDTDVVTPHIDALARHGMIFAQAYVAHPFCGPSRMGLFSGRMPHCFGGQANVSDVARNVRDFHHKGIPTSETLSNSALQQSGSPTACVDTWDLGDSKSFHPLPRGFNEFLGFLGVLSQRPTSIISS